MASLLATKLCNFFFFSSLFLFTTLTISISAYQFSVGGANGWIKPSRNETNTYVTWARRNRFHVGDSVYFKYKNDSVLLVDYSDYRNCSVSKPISKFNDGKTIFLFDRYGFFYFISGEPGHCEADQKVVIQVMAQSGTEPPESAPSPGSGGGGDAGGGSGSSDSDRFGPPRPNSTVKLSVESYFFTVLGWVVVIRYLFM